MTTKYNIEFSSAIQYFNEEIGFIDDINKYKKILSAFSKIFRLLKNGIIENKLLFKMPIKDFNNFLSNYAFLSLKDINVNLIYIVKKKKEINVFIEQKRYVLANYETDKEIDKAKMQIASLPNVIHSLDALYARRIINEFKKKEQNIFTIHDAFAVSINNIEFLITTA
jgi:DNA-directed RNA polymerase